MSVHQIILLVFFSHVLAGCGGDPTPRLPDLFGQDSNPSGLIRSGNTEWGQAPKIGLVIHSDATAHNAAPPIPPTYLETLTRRTQEFLRQHCSFQDILVMPPFSSTENSFRELQAWGQRLEVPYMMVVVFSSREKAGPEKLGEATMMTQMSGTVRENSALAEVGILKIPDRMVFLAVGQATETLEQLDVPIGQNRPSASEARDILRAQAGQQALDRALQQVKSACRHVDQR